MGFKKAEPTPCFLFLCKYKQQVTWIYLPLRNYYKNDVSKEQVWNCTISPCFEMTQQNLHYM